jgi:squalene-hopene/tetraprenyl-beta-curcumene cyclase
MKPIPGTQYPIEQDTPPPPERLHEGISRATDHLLSHQAAEGYWVFDLEADVTIPSEYILLQRFLGRAIGPDLGESIGRYIRRRQQSDGGWPLYADGFSDISATVKAYFALKLLGDPPDTPHMAMARRFVLSLGGASRVNVFTRIALALFGQIPWRTIPAMPVEIMLLPKWFFFHLQKVSYWSRTVIVPLLILYARKPVCPLLPEEGVRELFLSPPDSLRNIDGFVPGRARKNLFVLLDRILKRIDRFLPTSKREKAIRLAERWTIERMQGEGGIGGIFPAMANAVMALKVLDYPDQHPDFVRGIKALDDLLLSRGDESFCQPCLSPVWDTCLCLSAVLEAGLSQEHPAVDAAVRWLLEQQIHARGDWADRAPTLEPGGFAFQFENAFYPDVDDTAKALIALFRSGIHRKDRKTEQFAKAVNWVLGMQCSNGGWGAFDIDNRCLYLNDIPFADHGALLDPSTSDVTGRSVEMLSMLGYRKDFPPIERATKFLRREQEAFGAWYGRWGVNYIYGTWSVLMALRQAGEDMSQAYIRKAVDWLASCQNPDGGWGESCQTYQAPSLAGTGDSTASQTAWALLALLAAGCEDIPQVQRGIGYLLGTQNEKGGWDETLYTGTGFPRVFYLRYHGYSHYFPLWALGAYRRIREGGNTLQDEEKLWKPPNLPLPAGK